MRTYRVFRGSWERACYDTLPVKKAYHKLSLLVHPDRVDEATKGEATEKFKVLGFIHSILSSDDKRKIYDETGQYDEDSEEVVMKNWADYWKTLFKPITVQDINKYEKEYKGSDIEIKDLKRAYVDSKGDMDYILEAVPFTNCEEEPRLREIIFKLIEAEEVPEYESFRNEPKKKTQRRKRKRCKEKLNTLAISVMNQWPGVKLRVTEGWDEEGKHATDSLHYEGRAVDVTTSDRDRSKYGMLARLAVEAGFDWVYYESRSHIHCSVKSESSSVGKSGGCFPGRSSVLTSTGPKPLSSLEVGEEIASLDSNGEIVFSEMIAFLDYAPSSKRQFIRLTTFSGRQLTLTPSHLVPVEPKDLKIPSSTFYAANVQVGDRILVRDDDKTRPGGSRVRWDDVVEAELVLEEGLYAPLTREGTVIVDDVVASCYAIVNSQTIAQIGFFPLRILSTITNGLQTVKDFFWGSHETQDIDTNEIKGSKSVDSRWSRPEGIHWYANFLYSISTYVLPPSMLY
ncbi:indian hedgehog protein isoform X2 [Diachasmimorpha longicaudata]|uniref:indian hedgehog protein isoform X2 n=1 Tax=Diachasmimorpha longicaudata TaxID=58733 RepID=UPI0030B8E590